MTNSPKTSKKADNILQITEKTRFIRPGDIKAEETNSRSEIITDYAFFKSEGGLIKIDLEKVLFIEAESNYINIYYYDEEMELVEIEKQDEKDKDNKKSIPPKPTKVEMVRDVKKLILRVTLADAMERLPAQKFLRVSRSYAVSVKHVLKIGRTVAEFEGVHVHYDPSKVFFKKMQSRIIVL